MRTNNMEKTIEVHFVATMFWNSEILTCFLYIFSASFATLHSVFNKRDSCWRSLTNSTLLPNLSVKFSIFSLVFFKLYMSSLRIILWPFRKSVFLFSFRFLLMPSDLNLCWVLSVDSSGMSDVKLIVWFHYHSHYVGKEGRENYYHYLFFFK